MDKVYIARETYLGRLDALKREGRWLFPPAELDQLVNQVAKEFKLQPCDLRAELQRYAATHQ